MGLTGIGVMARAVMEIDQELNSSMSQTELESRFGTYLPNFYPDRHGNHSFGMETSIHTIPVAVNQHAPMLVRGFGLIAVELTAKFRRVPPANP